MNYVHAGRWTLCAHCRTGYTQHSTHYCGAPWQARPADWPEGWKVGAPEDSAALVREFAAWLDTETVNGPAGVLAIPDDYRRRAERFLATQREYARKEGG